MGGQCPLEALCRQGVQASPVQTSPVSFWRCYCPPPPPISKLQSRSPLLETSAPFNTKLPNSLREPQVIRSQNPACPLEKPKEADFSFLLNLIQHWKQNTKAHVQRPACPCFFFQLASSKSITPELKMETLSILPSQLQVRAGWWTNILQRPFDSLCLCQWVPDLSVVGLASPRKTEHYRILTGGACHPSPPRIAAGERENVFPSHFH